MASDVQVIATVKYYRLAMYVCLGIPLILDVLYIFSELGMIRPAQNHHSWWPGLLLLNGLLGFLGLLNYMKSKLYRVMKITEGGIVFPECDGILPWHRINNLRKETISGEYASIPFLILEISDTQMFLKPTIVAGFVTIDFDHKVLRIKLDQTNIEPHKLTEIISNHIKSCKSS